MYLRFYFIQSKSVLANFGSQKKILDKKVSFMTAEIDLVREK